jgi:LDH2 family malate/lactate/ureidoglycolate dehydrogenase
MNIPVPALTDFVAKLFVAAELPEVDAHLCAETLTLQEIRGSTTHGLRRVPPNLEGLTKGQMNPRPNRKVLLDDGPAVVLDGDHGVGMIGCMDAMGCAIAKAAQFGIGMGIVIHNNHFQSAAPYCLRAVEHKMIGICCSNTQASMAYPGTNTCAIGNNPIGFGIPTGGEFPIIFDSALTVSGGKLMQWIREGRTIPAAFLGIDKDGNPSDNPADVLFGGAPRPIGDYKGAGLAILVETLTGVLAGGAFLHGIQPPGLRTSKQNAESQCCIAVDIGRFTSLREFEQRVAKFIVDIKSNPLAPGYKEILLPGERAERTRIQSTLKGIPLETDVVVELRAWATQLNVGCPL